MSSAAVTRILHVIAAAARLAALYGLGILLLLSALVLWTGDWVGNARGILRLFGSVFGILFGLAFLLLAAARRLGFAALWVLLCAMWVWLLSRGWVPVGLLAVFVFWSVMALPFYVLGAIGFPSRRVLHVGRWTTTVPVLVLVGWVLLLVITLRVTPATYLLVASSPPVGSFGELSPLLKLGPALWAPAPILISLEALIRLWPSKVRASDATVGI
jgi:hypothetical protein